MGFARKQFTFYRSFYISLAALPPKLRDRLVWALIQYALDEIEPNLKDSTLIAVFETIRPVLDKARTKAQAGKTGGEASGETRSRLEAKMKQNRSENEAEGEEEKEIDIEFDVEGGERDGVSDVQIPPTESPSISKVLEVLRIFDVSMEDKDRAECRLLCAKYGTQAVIEAAKTADYRHVPRWSYVRAIVTSGGVGPRGGQGTGGVSRRVRESNAQCQRHDDLPTPASLKAAKDMLEWDGESWPPPGG